MESQLLRAILNDIRDAKKLIPPALIILVAGISWFLRTGMHPYIVFKRVSIPYPDVIINPYIVLTLSITSIPCSLIFLRRRIILKFLMAISAVISSWSVFTSITAVSGLTSFAMLLISIYAVGMPLNIVLVPLMAVSSLISSLVLLSRLLTSRRNINDQRIERLNILSKNSLGVIEAISAWLLAFIILMIPYLPWLNPHGFLVDVDHIYYIRWLRSTNWSNLWTQLISFCRGDRIAFLLPLYIISKIVPPVQLDKIYIAGVSALIPLIAESISRKLGIKPWFGYLSSLLASIPLYFIYGGYHANLAALIIALIALNYRLGLREVKLKSLLILSILSLLTVMTHTEAWVLYIPLFFFDKLTIIAWLLPGLSWMGLREAFLKPHYTELAHDLLFKGSPVLISPSLLRFQLNIMLWGVPATWLSYMLASIASLILTYKLLSRVNECNKLRKYFPMVASTSLSSLILFVPISRFVTHRIIMNTAFWVLIAYLLSDSWVKKHRWVVYIYVSMQLSYVIWLLVNSVPM